VGHRAHVAFFVSGRPTVRAPRERAR